MKGFQVLLTKNTKETAYFMIQFFEKHQKQNQDKPECVYEDTIVVKQKNTNITRDNVSIFMLCQIPSVSHVTATILIDNYKHISSLLEEMKQNPTLLEDFEYINPKTNKPKILNNIIVQNKIDEKIKANLKVASYVTTTTDIFANEIKKLNKNVIQKLNEYLK